MLPTQVISDAKALCKQISDQLKVGLHDLLWCRTEVHNLLGPRASAYYIQCSWGPKTKCYMLQFRGEVLRAEYKKRDFYFTSLFIAYGLIFLHESCLEL